MKILDRYCTREFLKYFTIIIVSFLSLYLIIDFFEKIRMFLSNQATVDQMASFFLFSIPMILWQVMPASVLIASLITFGSLSRSNEIMAMKACGISLYRATAPVLVIASLLCVANFLISEVITPYTNEKAKFIMLVEIQKKEAAGAFKQNQLWYRGKNGIYNFKIFDPKTNLIQGVTIYSLDSKLNLTLRVDAERGEWKDGRWLLRNVMITTFPHGKFPEITTASSKIAEIQETPDNFKAAHKDAEDMGYLELRRYIRDIQSAGYNATGYLVDLHVKLAFPLVNIIMAVIGLSFALGAEKKGAIAQGIAAGIIIGLSYWIVFAFTVSLGDAGSMSPFLAAWAADILFGAGAGLLFLRIRT